nr:hypothetical protein [Candidatus Sigynarchaeota archaeon]
MSLTIEELKKQIPDVFEGVKRDVKKVINRSRAGLNLGFVEMGISSQGFIGGMFFSGGTMILMNVTALDVLVNEINTNANKSPEMAISYVYHVMMHEYIHSLGFLDETTCQQVTRHVTRKLFPPDHPVAIMAERGIGVYFPRFTYAPEHLAFHPRDGSVELIKNFDKSNTMYFS